jgi:type IV pilus assembly protein PilB
MAGQSAEEKIILLAHEIGKYGIEHRASDIHIEPARLDGSLSLLFRCRIDDMLNEIRRMPISLHEALVARFKIMADVNPMERRMPQNGRIPVNYTDKDYDFRANFADTVYGKEAIVLRILDTSAFACDLDKLFLSDDTLKQLRDLIHRPSGMIVFSGPMGSGKSTTAYGSLTELASVHKKTITVEDPIEYDMPYLTKYGVNSRMGLTMPVILRSVLAQDPDVVFISDLPDLETTQLCVDLALTGHLVLSTMHSNDSVAGLIRLIEIGIEPYVIASSLVGITSQRLCRRVCPDCCQPQEIPSADLTRFDFDVSDLPTKVTICRSAGCPECQGKGYRGRVPLYEILTISEEIAGMIVDRASATEIRAATKEAGMPTLRSEGLCKVLNGLTTPEEVMRVSWTAGRA